MTDRAEEIFEDSCDVNMHRFNLNEFKETHKMLYSSILHAMENYAILKSQDDFKEKFPSKAQAYLKQKVSEITDEYIDKKYDFHHIYDHKSTVSMMTGCRMGARHVKEKLLNSK